MIRLPSAKLRLYVLITAVGSVAALASGRPEIVALVSPFAVYVAVGLALDREPAIILSAELIRERLLEGDEVALVVRVDARSDVPVLELELHLDPRLIAVSEPQQVLTARAGESKGARFTIRAERWGGYPAGTVSCRTHDRFGVIGYELPELALGAVRVFPRTETLRVLLDPVELQARTGNRVSRGAGEGAEFADVRQYVPGDRVRQINWRVTARRGALHVSDRHPERNADVILFLDTYAEASDQRDSTLARAVRAATSVAASYLASRDRVGVIGFGGVLQGLRPGLGAGQLYRILDALIGSEVVLSYAEKDVDFVPRRLLPPKALVIAITPMIDERSIRALFGLRARGFDLALIDVSPVPLTAPGANASDTLAHRLWILRRTALKARFERLGVAVSEWDGQEPLQIQMASANGFRRRARHAGAG